MEGASERASEQGSRQTIITRTTKEAAAGWEEESWNGSRSAENTEEQCRRRGNKRSGQERGNKASSRKGKPSQGRAAAQRV